MSRPFRQPLSNLRPARDTLRWRNIAGDLPFVGMPRFFLDVVDGAEVTPDDIGLEFDDLDTAVSEAIRGARDLVAHGIMQNKDVSGQSFLIRSEGSTVVATVRFRDTLPGQLRG